MDPNLSWVGNRYIDTHGAAWSDYDGDGDDDLAVGTNASSFHFLMRSNGVTLLDEAQTSLNVDTSSSYTTWFDYNKDGLADLFQGRDSGNLSLYFTQDASNGTFLTTLPQELPGCDGDWAFLTDLNDDDAPDYLCNTEGMFPKAAYDLTDPTFSTTLTSTLPSGSAVVDSVAVDINNDLRSDLILLRGAVSASGASQHSSNLIEISSDTGSGELVEFSFTGGTTLDIETWSPPVVRDSAQISDSQIVDGFNFNYDSATDRWTVTRQSSGWQYAYAQIKSSSPMSALTVDKVSVRDRPIEPVVHLRQNGSWVTATETTGLNVGLECKSIVAADFDNDMDQDLFMVCGRGAENMPNRLFENNGAGVFTEVPNAGGAAGATGAPITDGVGTGESVVTGDFDNNGFIDLFVTNGNNSQPVRGRVGPHEMILNNDNGNHWIQLKLKGVTSHADATGSRVVATAGGISQLRESGSEYHRWSQNDNRIHFGLGSNTSVDLTVRWPNGTVEQFNNVSADSLYLVTEGSGIAPVTIVPPAPLQPAVAGDECGQSKYFADMDTALFVERNCSTGRWSLRATAALGESLNYAGTVTSSGTPLAGGTAQTTEADDVLDRSNGNEWVFSFNTANGDTDGINLFTNDNDEVCLRATSPADTPVFIGPMNRPASLPLNLNTMQACSNGGGGGNTPPTLTSPGNQSTVIGSGVTLQLVGNDIDGDTLTYSATGLPAGLLISSSGLITGTASTLQTSNPTFSVSDGNGNTADIAITWIVTNTPNTPPTLTSPGDQSTPVGTSVNVIVSGNDVDGDPMTYAATGLPVGLAINEASGAITGTPQDAGTSVVTVTVSDDNGASNSAMFNWAVTAVSTTPTLSVNDVTVNEGAGTGEFIVSLTPAASSTVTVRAAATLATATPGQDYYGFSTLLTFAAGETSKTVPVTIINDTMVEPDESMGIRLFAEPSNVDVSDRTGILTIVDNDTAGNQSPTVTNPASQSTLVNTAVSLPIAAVDLDNDPLTYSATNLPVGLSIDPTSGVISGTPSTVSTTQVSVTADDGRGGTDTVAFTWNITATQVPSLSISDVTADEGAGTGEFVVTLNPASADTVTVIAAAGAETATAGQDYYGFAATLTFVPGETSKTVSVQIINDLDVESDETMRVRLLRPSSNVTVTKQFGVLTITDNDGASGPPAVSVNDATVNEGAGTGNFVLTLDKTSTDTITVRAAATAASALPGQDYYGFATLVTFIPGSTSQTVPVQIIDDTIIEDNETMGLRLFNVTNATIGDRNGILTIVDNDSVGNTNPVLTSPGNQQTEVNSTVSLQLVAEDLDGDSVTFVATGLPTGLTIDPITGLISGIASTVETATPAISIGDGNGGTDSVTFSWEVQPIANQAPVLTSPGNQQTQVNSTVSVQLVAEDLDGDNLTFAATGLPTGLTINPTGLISGVVSTVETATPTMTVSDGNGGTDSVTISWEVQPIANRAPVLTSPGNQQTQVNSTVSLQLVAEDLDGDNLTFAATGLPTGLTINPTGLISGVVSTVETATPTITVSDGNGGTDSVAISWEVQPIANRAPNLTSPGNQTTIANTPVSLQLTATDDDGDSLTYSVFGLPNGLASSASGLISGVPTQVGSFNTVIQVSDGSLIDFATITWTISMAPNNAPTINNPGSQTVTVNSSVSLQVSANDIDGDTVTFTATGLPAGLSISSSGLISGTPTTAQSTTSTITANDGNGGTDSANVSWTVEPDNSNQSPIVVTPGDQSGALGQSFNVQINAGDVDGDSLTYSATNLPTGLSINSTTGVISGSASAVGNWASTVMVSDGNGGTDSVSFDWQTTFTQNFENLVVRFDNERYPGFLTQVNDYGTVTRDSSSKSYWEVIVNSDDSLSLRNQDTGQYLKVVGNDQIVMSNSDTDNTTRWEWIANDPDEGHWIRSINTNETIDANDYGGEVSQDDTPDRDDRWFIEVISPADQWVTDPSNNDSANAGDWEISDPVETSSSGIILQPEDAANGQFALITDPRGSSSAGCCDVDGGVTSVRSPSIALAPEAVGTLSLNYFFAHLANASSADYFRITVVGSNSGSTVVFQETGNNNAQAANWQSQSIDISQFAGETIYLLIQAADNSDGSLIEAGVDDIVIE